MRTANSSERFIAGSVAGATQEDMNVVTADELAAQGFDRVSRQIRAKTSGTLVSIKTPGLYLIIPEDEARFIRTPTDVVLILGSRPNLTRAFRFGLDELRSQPDVPSSNSQPQALREIPSQKDV